MAKLNGKSLNIYISTDSGTTKKLAICMTSGEINHETEAIDTSSKCDDGWANSEAGRKSWNISGEGFSEAGAATGNQVSYRELRDLWANGTTFLAYWQDGTSGTYRSESGDAILTSITETANDNEFATFTFELQGKGELTIDV